MQKYFVFGIIGGQHPEIIGQHRKNINISIEVFGKRGSSKQYLLGKQPAPMN